MLKPFPWYLGFLTIIVVLSFETAFAAKNSNTETAKVRVYFPESTVIEGEEYRLGEISRIEGESQWLLEKLSSIVVGRSPLPGRELTVTRSLILSRLRAQKIDIKKLAFPGSDSTLIQRAALKISGKDIDRAVLEYIRENYKDIDFKPRLLAQSRDIYLPRGEISYTILPKGKYKKEGGYRNYEVEFKVNQKVVRKVPVRTYIKIYKEVYVARDTIKRNRVIEESDLLKIRKNVDRVPREYVTDKEQIIGKVATRTINPSEPLRGTTLSKLPLVESGDRLQIVYETAYLRLAAPGVSLAKGHEGDRIPVRNLESKIVVYATVKTRNVVQVN